MNFNRWMLLVFKMYLLINVWGCASFGKKIKDFLGGNGDNNSPEVVAKNNYTRFSENPQVAAPIRRQYHRTTKQTLADEAQLDNRSGSLWVNEGQGAYLFSQNIIRMIGDPMPIKLEGEPHDQLQAKVSVIKKLITKIELRNAPPRNLASTEGGSGSPNASPNANGNKNTKSGEGEGEKNTQSVQQPASGGGEDFLVQTVPTRITERLIDGNYRIRGSQPFMIGSREYKVIVTGIVRAEDFSEEGLSSSKLLDPKYDIVSVKRKEE